MARLKNDKVHKPLSAWEIITYSLGSLGREFSNNCVSAFSWFISVINAAALVLMFVPLADGTSEALRYTYYIAMYIIWGMSFTVLDVPFWSMLPTIADTTDERNKASSMSKLIGGLGGFLVGMVGTSLILLNFSNQGMKKAYLILGAVAGGIMVVFLLFTVIFNKEKYSVPHENVSISYIIQTFKNNDQLRAYAVSLLLYLTGTTIPLCIVGFIIYKKKYWLYGKKYADIKKEIDARRLDMPVESKESVDIT